MSKRTTDSKYEVEVHKILPSYKEVDQYLRDDEQVIKDLQDRINYRKKMYIRQTGPDSYEDENGYPCPKPKYKDDDFPIDWKRMV